MGRKSGAMDTSSDDKSSKAGPSPAVGNNNALILAQLLQQAQQQHGHHVAAGLSGVASDSSLQAALASIMAGNSAAANKHLLPNSAPVSNLLPQIPNMGANSAALQSQFAALLSGVGGGGGNPLSQTPSVHSMPSHPQFAVNHNNQGNQMLRHHVPPPATASVPSTLAVPNMQHWSVDRLKQHVQLLEQLKQPVPQTVSLLLSEAKRKEDKRNAKRIANRKSASTSRARKKQYVQEMTELNARLKRQALILSLLPDMVIVIGVEGNITFCSAQAEKILRYDMQELVGVNLAKLLVPASKDKLNRLVKELLGSEKAGRSKGEPAVIIGDAKGEPVLMELEQESNAVIQPVGVSSGENSAPAGKATVVSERMSEPSFPLSVVQVEAKREKVGKKKKSGVSDEQDNSDTSNTSASDPRKQPSSLTDSKSSGRSATGAFPKESIVEATSAVGGDAAERKAQFPSSDVSNTSSISSNAKNVQQANTNLERNVRIHNKKMRTESGSKFKDDVTGAGVTANNASARLSSLQHRPESSSSEEDSGYRESNDSREETSSSVSDSSGSNGRRKPIAPTCNICLIRKDMTTLWCEVTSSIRTKEPEEDEVESLSMTGTDSGKRPLAKPVPGAPLDTRTSSEQGDTKEVVEPEIELLLCLRPVRDGDQKIQGKLRFEGSSKKKKKRPAPDNAWEEDAPSPAVAAPNRPFKKRGLAEVSNKDKSSTSKGESTSKGDNEEADDRFRGVDTDAAESLMLMTKKTP